jgi:hypothetical protein
MIKKQQPRERERAVMMDSEEKPVSLESHLDRFIAYEVKASSIRSWQPDLIPGLLQTEEYATAVMASYAKSGGKSGDELAAGVSRRLSRQALLERQSVPELSFVIGEMALPYNAAFCTNAAMMKRQCQCLHDASGRFSVRVLPAGAAAPVSSFVLMSFSSGRGVLYEEKPDHAVFDERDIGELSGIRAVHDSLVARSLDIKELL